MASRKSSEAGTIGGAQFPILCNADLQRLDCHIDDNGISIRILEKNGQSVPFSLGTHIVDVSEFIEFILKRIEEHTKLRKLFI